MTVPFEQRVYPAMQSGWPRMATLVGFCPSSNLTPALVERLVLEAEEAIGEPIRHTIRKLFPKKLDRGIADEVGLAWKAPKRVLTLSNQLSCPNHVLIAANLRDLKRRPYGPCGLPGVDGISRRGAGGTRDCTRNNHALRIDYRGADLFQRKHILDCITY